MPKPAHSSVSRQRTAARTSCLEWLRRRDPAETSLCASTCHRCTTKLPSVNADPGGRAGHGLRIVESCATRWGAISRPSSKQVWLKSTRTVRTDPATRCMPGMRTADSRKQDRREAHEPGSRELPKGFASASVGGVPGLALRVSVNASSADRLRARCLPQTRGPRP
jgi:hypothetical protein